MSVSLRRLVPPLVIACWLFCPEPCLLIADEAGAITVVDEQRAAHDLSLADLQKLPRKSIKVPGREQEMIDYTGVPLTDVLQHVGVALGKDLRGPRVASYVLLEAADGYRVVLALAEVDPATTDKVVLLADHRNGTVLDDKEGPFRLVIPDDKRPVRWIRMIRRISVERAAAK